MTAGKGSYSTSMSSSASSATYLLSATTTATASPTYLTTSFAMGGWSTALMSESGTCHAHGMPLSAPSVSAAVNTATTPSRPQAALVSIDVMRACACGLRSIAA